MSEQPEATEEPSDLVLMEVKGMMMDPVSNVPIVILRSDDTSQFLPIWIGVFEANAIAIALEGVEVPRPMTHDLALDLIEGLSAEVEQIIITRLEDSTFYAVLRLQSDAGKILEIDARPSDAIAIALRADVEIMVSSEVLARAKASDESELSHEEKVKKWLEELDPDDLGKYTM